MRRERIEKGGERGSTLLEFTFVAATFFTMLLAITAGANLYFTNNALMEATRRGARFAATQKAADPAGTLRTTGGCDSTGPKLTAIRNYAIYGNEAGNGPKILSNLNPANICVEYTGFGVGTGTVAVRITSYNYNLVIPGISRQMAMPANRTTMRGEGAGTLPTTCP